MSERTPTELIEDIIEAINRIMNYIDNLTYNEFLNDLKTQDAVVRNIEIIGEAAKKIPLHIRQKYSRIPWKEIAGTRDKLIHDYFGVNFDIVWAIIKNDLPELRKQIESIKSDMRF
ncbi:DUF86 domain-containing protein [Kosmotoga olearia]|uniref:DUF86 domain-containing protein n=1 Tax=Kosmotoga olearia (strain ATCC BAA-1733 / DSM 21960 / TBF 19.5.1) TaxID=521045 RepID=C5CIW8_KOSOT|nr:DUF86 domain-containing protein [Kosmotoga olearia]ACR78957.1 protein of unknown function DUF86 [Kosmotoga olearia TBF 19.5.1]MDK2953894.1 hypothetical protein [Kosmotoga sp.]